MYHIWTFSPTSKELLQQCLNAAAPSDNSNKWIKQFGPKNLDITKKEVNTVVIEDSPDMEISIKQEIEDQEMINASEDVIDEDYDIESNFDSFQENCILNPKILTKLAENTATSAMEKLIQHVFDTASVNNEFLDNFFEYFLPVYIKKDNSRASTDLLFNINKLFPRHIKSLLKVILKDVTIQNNILQDFVSTLSSVEQTELFIKMTDIDLSGEEFTHHILNILTAYKNCNKTENVQKYIFSLLNTHCQFCSIDKNYGKLLLAYLQQEKVSKHVEDKLSIKRIVETHKSPFRKPCLAILKELNYG